MRSLGSHELDQDGRRKWQGKETTTGRIVMALFRGRSLITPMLLIKLFRSRNTSLITVSVATFAFAFVLAVGALDSTVNDVPGATAAYAAVLVVSSGRIVLQVEGLRISEKLSDTLGHERDQVW